MNINDLKLVLKTAHLKNISAAATQLDLSPAAASAAIKRIEKDLGVELFIRSTRQLRLSTAGEKFLPQCEQALELLDQAQKNLQLTNTELTGEIRITAPSDLGRNHLIYWLNELMQIHPKLRLKINLSDSPLDFYQNSFDMALRYGEPNDAGLYGFKICDVPTLVCASREYLQTNPTPQCPNDLLEHNALLYQIKDVAYDTWSFQKQGKIERVKLSGNRMTNDADLVRLWCQQGHGVALKSVLDSYRELISGNLIPLLPDYQARVIELWLVFPSKQSITPAGRLLRDILREKSAYLLKDLVDKGVLQKMS